MKLRLFGLLSALLIVGGIGGGAMLALAQAPGVPTQMIASPSGNEQIRIVNSGPQIANIIIRQVRDASGYLVQTQAATNTVTVPNGASAVALTGAIAGTATITFPPAPVDGQRMQVFSTAGLTTATFTANTGQTVNSAPTSIPAGGSVEFVYQLSTTTWFRIQ